MMNIAVIGIGGVGGFFCGKTAKALDTCKPKHHFKEILKIMIKRRSENYLDYL